MEAIRRTLFLQTSEELLGPSLESFSEACLALTPKIAIFSNNILFLDIGITELAFGGEEQQLDAAARLIDTFDLQPTVVVSDRPEWAWALAIQKHLVLPSGSAQMALYSLPIHRLIYCGHPKEVEQTLSERQHLVQFMARVGMETIADFAKLSPLAINRRFGKLGCHLLEWVMGSREFPLPSFFPESPIQERIEAEGVSSMEQLLFTLRQAFTKIEARLRGRNLEAKQLKIRFILDSSPDVVRTLNLSEPIREAQQFTKLLQDFLRQVEWKSPLQRVELKITDTSVYHPGQLSLLDDMENKKVDLGQYVTRLRNRFGENSVGFPVVEPNHLPERSWKNTWPPKAPSFPRGHFPNRPLFLFTPPRPYHVASNACLRPTENLATEWWNAVGQRQYYTLDTKKGQRLWVYWDNKEQSWFLHGSFD